MCIRDSLPVLLLTSCAAEAPPRADAGDPRVLPIGATAALVGLAGADVVDDDAAHGAARVGHQLALGGKFQRPAVQLHPRFVQQRGGAQGQRLVAKQLATGSPPQFVVQGLEPLARLLALMPGLQRRVGLFETAAMPALVHAGRENALAHLDAIHTLVCGPKRRLMLAALA